MQGFLGSFLCPRSLAGINMAVSRDTWRWVVLVAILLGTTIADGLLNTSGVYIIAWRDYFECSMAEASSMTGTVLICYCFGM